MQVVAALCFPSLTMFAARFFIRSPLAKLNVPTEKLPYYVDVVVSILEEFMFAIPHNTNSKVLLTLSVIMQLSSRSTMRKSLAITLATILAKFSNLHRMEMVCEICHGILFGISHVNPESVVRTKVLHSLPYVSVYAVKSMCARRYFSLETRWMYLIGWHVLHNAVLVFLLG